MLKDLLGGCLMLTTFGFVLIWSSSPDVPQIIMNKLYPNTTTVSQENVELVPDYVMPINFQASDKQELQISLVAMQDHYNGIPFIESYIR